MKVLLNQRLALVRSRMQSRGCPEHLCRPLGIGYDGYHSFLYQYACPTGSPERNPDLAISLAGLQHAVPFVTISEALRSQPRCLIQGITSPGNGTSLRRFLETHGVAQPVIHAIDIADVAAVLATMGMSLPDVHFSVADATNLPAFATGSVQILVQDHLLNCTPHGNHEAIVREAARLLDRRGFLILNFSVEPRKAGGQIRTRADIEVCLGRRLSDRAYCLRDLTHHPDEQKEFKARVMGQTVALDNAGRMILITPPQGNFEFYFPIAQLEDSLSRHGLRFDYVTRESGVDSNGFSCLRYRTIVRHGE
jgi:hypothetical protein